MAMGGRAMIVMVLVVVGLVHNAEAATYLVGNPGSNGGWTFASSDTQYDDQFKGINLVVNDTLTFSFVTGAHNVYVVPPENVVSCDTSNFIFESDVATNITLLTAGDYGFICGFPNHCSVSGMYLSITVQDTAAPAPAPAPAPVSASAPEPGSGS